MSYAQNYLKMDKIDRLLDAIEHPDRYSEKEIDVLLSDPEVREVYNLLDKTRSSLAPIPTPDIDAEWDRFSNSHTAKQFRTNRLFNLISRNVAASIAIGLASLAAVAAVVGVSVNHAFDKNAGTQSVEVAPATKDNVLSNDTIVVVEEVPAVAPETIVFDNEPLENIINHIARYYGYKAEYSTDAAKSLRLYFRWNQAQTVDEVVESLDNFEQINLTVKDKTIKID